MTYNSLVAINNLVYCSGNKVIRQPLLDIILFIAMRTGYLIDKNAINKYNMIDIGVSFY